MPETPPFQAEFEQRLKEILAQRSRWVLSPARFNTSVKRVWSNRFINNRPSVDTILRPRTYIKAFYILGFIYIVFWMGVVEYKTREYLILLLFLPFIIAYCVGSLWYFNREIIVSARGISLNGEFTLWLDITECYIMQSPRRNNLRDTLFILLTTGDYIEYDLRAIDRNDAANYIYKFKAEAQAGTF